MFRSVTAHIFASLLTGLSMIVFAWAAFISLLFFPGFDVMTPGAWIIVSLIGALPLLVIGTFIHYLRHPTGNTLLRNIVASGIPLVFGFLVVLSRLTSTTHWSSGPYEVYEVDPGSGIEFGEDVGGGTQGLVMAPVSGIGEDRRWIVIQRAHPNRDPASAEYFYLPKVSDDPKKYTPDLLEGPFDKATFDQKSAELHLPPITHTFPRS